jgi:hypothetical protein
MREKKEKFTINESELRQRYKLTLHVYMTLVCAAYIRWEVVAQKWAQHDDGTNEENEFCEPIIVARDVSADVYHRFAEIYEGHLK